jgi:hypothetical protein
MTKQVEPVDVIYTAGQDLRGRKFHAVKRGRDRSSRVFLHDGPLSEADGILQNDPEENAEAIVRISGTSKLKGTY